MYNTSVNHASANIFRMIYTGHGPLNKIVSMLLAIYKTEDKQKSGKSVLIYGRYKKKTRPDQIVSWIRRVNIHSFQKRSNCVGNVYYACANRKHAHTLYCSVLHDSTSAIVNARRACARGITYSTQFVCVSSVYRPL